ncbi:MAG: DUF4870 domain-containing protein [Oscillospiraceae bacterium]|jgi:uncharacterized membrane protein|nr:DUF4870 domain-containing protein [Oscillospiraceae bacterium]
MAFCEKCGTQIEDGKTLCQSCSASYAQTSFVTTDVEANKLMAVLSYLSILALVPYFAAPNSKFARAHAIQGLNLLIIVTICEIIGYVIAAIPIIGIFGTLAVSLVGLASLALSIIGIINVFNGVYKDLPFIDKIKFIKQ